MWIGSHTHGVILARPNCDWLTKLGVQGGSCFGLSCIQIFPSVPRIHNLTMYHVIFVHERLEINPVRELVFISSM